MKPLFTPEELAELAVFDAEIDDEPLSAQDYRDSAQRDKDEVFAEKGEKQRRQARKIAAKQREYYEANKDQIAAKRREYREANKDQIAAYKREYYEANKDQIAAYKREYMLNRRSKKRYGIGNMIREARKRAGMNQKMLASLVGIYQPQLSNYERNLIVPTKPILIRISDALGVSLETMTMTKGT